VPFNALSTVKPSGGFKQWQTIVINSKVSKLADNRVSKVAPNKVAANKVSEVAANKVSRVDHRAVSRLPDAVREINRREAKAEDNKAAKAREAQARGSKGAVNEVAGRKDVKSGSSNPKGLTICTAVVLHS